MMLMCCDTGLGMASRRSVRYAQLPGDDDEDYADGGGRRDFDPRFDYTPKAFDRVPWKSIALAVFLLFLGCLLLLLAVFIFTGHMEGDSSQGYALLVLGFLTFLPGKSWIELFFVLLIELLILLDTLCMMFDLKPVV